MIIVRKDSDGQLSMAIGPLMQRCFRATGTTSELVLLVASWPADEVGELFGEISKAKTFIDELHDVVGDLKEVK